MGLNLNMTCISFDTFWSYLLLHPVHSIFRDWCSKIHGMKCPLWNNVRKIFLAENCEKEFIFVTISDGCMG